MENTNMNLELVQKRDEVTNVIENAVSQYYNVDFNSNSEETLKKKQNIAMFVSKLITTTNKDDKPAILTASNDSIRECALAFVNGDFDFFRNQAYLIAYGNKLSFITSKDGLVAGAKKMVKGLELFSDIVYKGDKFEYEKIGGRTIIKKHDQPIENITCKIEDIVCAYAVAWVNGEQVEANIMTMKEISNALTTAHRSITDFHRNNPKIMFGKFPLRQLAKKIINQNIAPEVSKVLNNDYETIEIEPHNIVTNDEPVNLNFNEKPIEKINDKASTKIEQNQVQENVEQPHYGYENVAESVSLADMMAQNEQEQEERTIKYADWRNGLKEQMSDWEMVKNSWNASDKTIIIRKVK